MLEQGSNIDRMYVSRIKIIFVDKNRRKLPSRNMDVLYSSQIAKSITCIN